MSLAVICEMFPSTELAFTPLSSISSGFKKPNSKFPTSLNAIILPPLRYSLLNCPPRFCQEVWEEIRTWRKEGWGTKKKSLRTQVFQHRPLLFSNLTKNVLMIFLLSSFLRLQCCIIMIHRARRGFMGVYSFSPTALPKLALNICF